jgi:hypothetical protein
LGIDCSSPRKRPYALRADKNCSLFMRSSQVSDRELMRGSCGLMLRQQAVKRYALALLN